jgi:hypothetical protein
MLASMHDALIFWLMIDMPEVILIYSIYLCLTATWQFSIFIFLLLQVFKKEVEEERIKLFF